jgi:stearoyl-CoA desaturase (delta-9 desaturase)
MNIDTPARIPGSLLLTGEEAFKNRCTAALGAGLPAAATGLAAALSLTGVIHPGLPDLVIVAAMYTITGLGVTVGMHRLFSHKSFEAGPWTQGVLAVLGIMALQGSVASWVACHRRHHRYSDTNGDPHSPIEHHRGKLGAMSALYYIHCSRLFMAEDTSIPVYAPDMQNSAMIRKIDRLSLLWIFLTLALPAMASWLWEGGVAGALSGLLWGGLVRIFLGQHIGSCVNSVCHMFGKSPFNTGDQSKNNFWVGIAAFGEGWHNNHHAFPTSARQGLLWWQLDLSYFVITILKTLGLAWNVRVPTSENISKKAALVPAAV